MSPLTLTLTLMLNLMLNLAEAAALVTALRTKVWRVVPSWVFYVTVATLHVSIGLASYILGNAYPMALLYSEPIIILGQIALAFESSTKFLGLRLTGGSPENRLLVWLVLLVPAAVVLPIEITFLRDALLQWRNQEAESLKLLYNMRLFLSITLFVILTVIPLVARLSQGAPKPAVVFHHHLVTAYMACSAFGYFSKTYTSGSMDYLLTMLFFVVGPMLCFLIWSWRMWQASPVDWATFVQPNADNPIEDLERGVVRAI